MAEKLGARKNSSWKAICTAPDFCKTPVGSSTPPIPYQVIADLGQSESCVPNVRFNGDPCKVLDQSIVPKCTGDEPGTAKGVKSGTVADKVEPVSASTTVRAGKKRVVRELDPCTLNSGNCPGIYTTQPAPGSAIGVGGKPTPKEPAVAPDTPKEVQAAKEGKGLWGKLSGPVHFVLGAAGFIPGLGAVPDLLDAGVYALEGDMISAGLSAGAAVPFAGDAVKAGTIVGKAGKQIAKAAAEKALKEKLEREAKEKLAREAKKKTTQNAGEAAEGAAKKEGTDGIKVKDDGKKKKKDPCKALENGIPGEKYRGGKYSKIAPGGKARGMEAHHMPADSASPIDTNHGMAIQMDKIDHQRTASYDNVAGSRIYRDSQTKLISKGKAGMLAALMMDVVDIRKKFGNKYDSALAQMMAYAKCKGYV